MIPRYMGLPHVTDKPEQGDGAWAAEATAFEAVGGARPKRPSLPGNLGTLEPEDERLLEVSEGIHDMCSTGSG